MKRVLIFILALLCMAVPALADSAHVYDPDGMLDAAQSRSLEMRAQALDEQYGVDILIAITLDGADMHGYDYAPLIYEAMREGDAQADHGALAVLPDNRTYGFDIEGVLGYAVNRSGGVERLEEILETYLRRDDYAGAANAFLDYAEALCGREDYGKLPTAFEIANGYLLLVLIIAALVAGLVLVVMIGRLKTAKYARAAGEYVVRDSLKMSGVSDIFLYETITRRKIQSQSSSGRSSGGSGGSRARGGGSF